MLQTRSVRQTSDGPRGANRLFRVMPAVIVVLICCVVACDASAQRTYENRLVPIEDPKPLLADYPEYVQPVLEARHYEAPPVVTDTGATLSVRAWRFSYNMRGIIEIPNQLDGTATAVIVVHPWGIDDGQGRRTPEPAGAAFQCTPNKNRMMLRHASEVVNPMLRRLRPHVGLVMYSLPGHEDPVRKKLYRSIHGAPTAQERIEGRRELAEKLADLSHGGQSVPAVLTLSRHRPVADYFRQFPGLQAGDRYNGAGFWDLPMPVSKGIDVCPNDVVFYDGDGCAALKQFLRDNRIRHVLLGGYNTDMCVKSTPAGYENLRKDFNVFLVGDATLATSPANKTPAYATNAAISSASLELLITQVSWVQPLAADNQPKQGSAGRRG